MASLSAHATSLPAILPAVATPLDLLSGVAHRSFPSDRGEVVPAISEGVEVAVVGLPDRLGREAIAGFVVVGNGRLKCQPLSVFDSQRHALVGVTKNDL